MTPTRGERGSLSKTEIIRRTGRVVTPVCNACDSWSMDVVGGDVYQEMSNLGWLEYRCHRCQPTTKVRFEVTAMELLREYVGERRLQEEQRVRRGGAK